MKKTSPEPEGDDMLPSYDFDYRKAKPNRFAAASRQAKNIRIIGREGSSRTPSIIPIFGNKLYQQRARAAFPILVRQAKGETPIPYSDLAAELGMSNPQSLSRVLGAIAQTVDALSENLGEVPPIQFLAVQKHKDFPGDGVMSGFGQLSIRQKRELVKRVQKEIFSYEHWDNVLDLLGLHVLPVQTKESLEFISSYGWGGIESREHQILKEYVANSPEVLDLRQKILGASVEYALPSGDMVDVFVQTPEMWIAVEVKTAAASYYEILRGLFQCVKYKALLKALAAVQGAEKEVESILVLEGTLPTELRSTKNSLGFPVIEEVKAA